MSVKHVPATQAIRLMRDNAIPFTEHAYRYVDHGGTEVAARELGLDEHAVIKTLVFVTDAGVPIVMLMHGDRQVSTRNLARSIGAKSVAPCSPQEANKHTGYTVGGISPFGTRRKLDIYVEMSILELPRIFINAGRRGLLMGIDPGVLTSGLGAIPVHAAT